MEDTTLEQRLHAITHILTNPTTKPSLHSQFFISNQIPCYLNWDYPPILCSKSPSLLPRWVLSLFLRRVLRLGAPRTSWRSKCPFQQPPPLILAKGLEEAEWDAAQRMAYVRKRLARKPIELHVNPLIPVVIPNLFLFSLLFWDPFTDEG
ncbi:hypothetical protein L6164_036729 [Bauhinia variegata]|uniref:Uncharacterized protein n=1 Tax=Bauhinia variegata TaxID=167791 RepID=A0ACB9KHZ6_BAUVA|nr:hypothetical protein L6164_036729 [Bauhinia variegata]